MLEGGINNKGKRTWNNGGNVGLYAKRAYEQIGGHSIACLVSRHKI